MNFTATKNSSPTCQKFSNDNDAIQLQNQQFANNEGKKCSTELLVFSKCVLKNFANFTGKQLSRLKREPKNLIYPCSLHFHYKRDSCTQLFFSELCRIFKNTFLLEHSWASTSGFILNIFKSNKCMKVSFLLTIFTEKVKKKRKKAEWLQNWKILHLLCNEVALLLNYFFFMLIKT